MSRAYLGLAALDVLLLLAGYGLLAAFGHVRTARSALRLAGLAFVVGFAATGLVCTVLLVAGLSLAVWQVVLVCLGLAAVGAAVAWLTPAVVEPARAAIGRAWVVAALGATVVVLYVEELGRRAFAAGAAYHTDAWGFWLPKAKAIVLFGGLDTAPGGATSFFHPDYPLLVPGMDAVAFRFMGGLHASVLPVQEWLFATAFLAAIAGLLWRRVPAYVLAPCLALVALSPAFGRWIGVGLADEPLAMLVAVAGVAVALWLLEDQGGHVALAALLLAAASVTKTEGRSLALILAALAAAASVRSLRSRWPGLLALVLAPLLAGLPWRLWLDANDVPIIPDYRIGDAFDTGYLGDRTDRLELALRELPAYLVGRDDWLLVLPIALAAGVLVARRVPALALLLVGFPVLVLVGLVLVFWISVLPLEGYIEASAERTVLTPLLLAGVLLPLALAALLADEGGGARAADEHGPEL